MAQTIRMLQQAGDWPAGVIVAVEDRRAERLVRTGYAERVTEDAKEKESSRGSTKPRHRV
jgi:hypothetical protein